MAEEFRMLSECSESYTVIEDDEGRTTILITIPEHLRDLWLMKLTNLTVTDDEIAQYSEGSEPDTDTTTL